MSRNVVFDLPGEEVVSRLMELAFGFARLSPDPSTQNGGFLVNQNLKVLGQGFNEFPAGVSYNPERWERPAKYSYIEHAERNSIFDAAKAGNSTRDTTMIVVWAACADCARAIVQSGVSRVIRCAIPHDADESAARWRDSVLLGDTILTEGDVEIVEFAGELSATLPEIRRDGKLWRP